MISAKIVKTFTRRRDASGFDLDVDLNANTGSTVLFGPSGAGKTLTLDCIAGFIKPDSGRILLRDRILFDGASQVNLKPQARRCGYVFQNYALFPHMTLRQNLAFAADRLPRLERTRKTEEILDQFRLRDVAGRKPHEVSGGQQQRCSIARALIGGPEILLLDEPARGLDATLRTELYEVLHQVRERFDTPLIIVTHDLDEAFALATEMVIMANGRIVQAGSPAEVSGHPASADVAKLLGIYNVVPAELRSLDPSRNSSLIRVGDQDIAGVYYPGHFNGDAVQLCIAIADVMARPNSGTSRPGELHADLQRAVTMPHGFRLEFTNGIQADLPLSMYDPAAKRWLIELPPRRIQIL